MQLVGLRCDAVTVSHWTSEVASGSVMQIACPVTQKLQGPSTTKYFRNYKCFYGVPFPEFFSATLYDSNFLPPPFISVGDTGTSVEV